MTRLRNYRTANRFALFLYAIEVFLSSISNLAFALETFGVLTEEESKEEYLLDNRSPKDAPHQHWRHWMCFENKGVRFRCRKIYDEKYRRNLMTGFELTTLEKPLRFELSVVHSKDDCIGYLAEIKSYIRSYKHFCAFGEMFERSERMDIYKMFQLKSKKGLWTFPATEP